MNTRIAKRRNTVCGPSGSQHDDLEEEEQIGDVEENAVSSGGEYDDGKSEKKNINCDDEDVLIQTILKYYDVVENKSTDKHLTSKQLEKNQLAAWTKIQDEFVKTTKVSFDVYYVVTILSKFM